MSEFHMTSIVGNAAMDQACKEIDEQQEPMNQVKERGQK